MASGIVSLLASALSNPVGAEHCRELAAHVVSVEGDVSVAGSAARMNDEICAGTRVEVGHLARAAIRLEATQTVVRIDQDSVFVIRPTDNDRSWLELLQGVIYLFSRRPEALRVDTPYVNAAIDGTEFVVGTSGERSEITVIEGRVRAANAAGELTLAPGETVIASSSGALARRSVVDPQDAVRWALHYPPIGAAERTSGEAREAAARLVTGDVESASRLLATAPEDAVSLALESMIAVTQNRPLDALRLAERAVQAGPASSVARTALSYAQQAGFDIEAALESARSAVRNDPRDAHALARQAELELGVDDAAAALASAREAIRVDPDNSLAHTVLGFVYLVRLESGAARTAFADAIAHDPGDPLPRLGLGLATIRDGRLVEGREQIEVAASLDPGDALIRSYLGKAYFEERQLSDAAAQFALAKSLDPQDPTPWFYDALLDQALNRPASAFRNIERASALNDNQLVYQSRLLVDKSEAAGSLSLARIYTDFGFEWPAILESTRSIETDPTNFSAYRFLADSYAQRERHEAARRSVLFQAALLQPLTIDPVQPYAQESDLLILPGTDPVDPSIREYSPLFDREGFQLAGSLVGGSDDTFGDNLVVSGLHDRVAYSLGQFHYETDGLRPNTDVEHDVYHGFVQGQLRPTLFVQAALHGRETDQGQFALNFDPDGTASGRRSEVEVVSPRIGLRAELGPRSTLLLAARAIDRTERTSQPLPAFTQRSSLESDGHEASARLIHRGSGVTHSLGVDVHDLDLHEVTVFDIDPCPLASCTVDPGALASSYTNYYYHAGFGRSRKLYWTLALGYTTLDDERAPLDRQVVSPGIGLRWRATPSHEIRLAASGGVKRASVADLTLEPTVLAGFNQVHDDFAGTRYINAGIAHAWRIGPKSLSGTELFHRELDSPVSHADPANPEIRVSSDNAQRETMFHGYWNRILRPDLSLGLALGFERSERDDSKNEAGLTDLSFPLSVETLSLPISIHYAHPSGFFVHGETSFVRQWVERTREGTDTDVAAVAGVDEERESFTNIDLSLGFRLPTRQATLRLDVGNVLDEAFLFRGSNIRSVDPSSARFSPGRTLTGRVSFSFR